MKKRHLFLGLLAILVLAFPLGSVAQDINVEVNINGDAYDKYGRDCGGETMAFWIQNNIGIPVKVYVEYEDMCGNRHTAKTLYIEPGETMGAKTFDGRYDVTWATDFYFTAYDPATGRSSPDFHVDIIQSMRENGAGVHTAHLNP